MKQPKQFKRYVPKLIKDKLDQLTYHRKDDLYVILDLIHRKEVYYKSDYQNKYGFTEIALAQFKELVASSDNLNEGIQFLVYHNLLLRNDYFVMGVKPKSYKIPREYLGKTIPVIITDKNINKRIEKQLKKVQRMKVQSLEFAKTEYYKTFKIDIDGANKAILERTLSEIKSLCYRLSINISEADILDIIECRQGHQRKRLLIMVVEKGVELDNIIHRHMIYTTRINAINDGFLFFKRNTTNRRLDTNLTSLPSFLRPFLIASEKLMNIDIKNSQPYFLYTQIQNKSEVNTKEIAKYGELVVSGQLYEYLVEQYKKQTGYDRARNQMKGMLYKIFFSKVGSYKSQKQFFGGLFPTLMDYINTTNELFHNTLAVQLQTKESNTVLDIIMPMLEQQGIRPYTIHDSFVCKESEAITIKDIFTSKLTELYGVAPALHLDYLILPVIEEIEEENDPVFWNDEFISEVNTSVDAAELKSKN